MRKALVAAAFAASTLSLAGVAGAAAEKYPLVGPDAVVFCDDAKPFPGDDASGPEVGFVVFNHSEDNSLKATVSLKEGLPNTDYPVRLVQNFGDCFEVDAILTTNNQGNGTVNIREASTPAGEAQVIVDTGVVFNNPTYRATERYVWS